MGLKNLFQKGAQAIISAFGDIPKVVTYKHYGQKIKSGAEIIHPSTDIENISMVFSGYRADEIDGENVLSTDVKAIVAYLDLGIDLPTSDDIVTDEDSNTFSVESWKKDPADAAWIIQLRSA